jgi:uncharacterized protein (DUF488 family)
MRSQNKAARRQADEPVCGGPRSIFTVGHSTQSLEDLVELLRRHDMACLVDVRSYPSSRRMPHFAKEALERSLPAEGIDYLHLRGLGGRRRPRPGSRNPAWRNEGFRGYADHMETDEFLAALDRLVAVARDQRSVIMCAEALWWRCHRRLLSDALLARGWSVQHIDREGEVADHELTPFAVVERGRVSYAPAQASLEL